MRAPGGPPRRPRWTILLACAGLFPGCSTPEEAMSPAEWIDANQTVFSKVRSYEESERKEGISRLKALGREEGTAVMYLFLSDPKLQDYRLEVVLARLLAEWKDSRAIPFLLQNLSVPDDGAVRIAAEGLLVFGDHPHVMDALVEMVAGVTVGERQTAADLLAKIGTDRAVAVLGGRLKAELDPEVRARMVIGVIQSRDSRRAEYLIDALTDQEEAIRDVAWGALRRLPGLPSVEYRPGDPPDRRAKAIGELRIWLAGSGRPPSPRR